MFSSSSQIVPGVCGYALSVGGGSERLGFRYIFQLVVHVQNLYFNISSRLQDLC